jgi:hypothetical protein
MFPTLNWVRESCRAYATGEETIVTVLTLERNNPNQRRNQFTRSLWSCPHDAVLVTPWARHLATHSMCCFLISTPPPAYNRTIKAFPPQSS